MGDNEDHGNNHGTTGNNYFYDMSNNDQEQYDLIQTDYFGYIQSRIT